MCGGEKETITLPEQVKVVLNTTYGEVLFDGQVIMEANQHKQVVQKMCRNINANARPSHQEALFRSVVGLMSH